MGRRNSTLFNSRRGKKELKSSRDKNARHEPYRVTPDLSYDYTAVGGRDNARAKTINGMEKRKKKKEKKME